MIVSRSLSFTAIALASFALGQAAAKKGDDKHKPLAPQFDAAGGQRYMEACTPDFHHAKLADWIGTWDTEMAIHSAGPDAPATITKGTAEFSWLFENRWLQQRTQCELAMGAMKFDLRGLNLLGFDRYKNKYVGAHCDSMTTNLLTFEGNFDRSDSTLLMFGSMDEPMNNEHDKCVKYVWRLLSKDKMVFEVHDLPIGESATKVVEITYTRRAK